MEQIRYTIVFTNVTPQGFGSDGYQQYGGVVTHSDYPSFGEISPVVDVNFVRFTIPLTHPLYPIKKTQEFVSRATFDCSVQEDSRFWDIDSINQIRNYNWFWKLSIWLMNGFVKVIDSIAKI